jgi:hypothetical protein
LSDTPRGAGSGCRSRAAERTGDVKNRTRSTANCFMNGRRASWVCTERRKPTRPDARIGHRSRFSLTARSSTEVTIEAERHTTASRAKVLPRLGLTIVLAVPSAISGRAVEQRRARWCTATTSKQSKQARRVPDRGARCCLYDMSAAGALTRPVWRTSPAAITVSSFAWKGVGQARAARAPRGSSSPSSGRHASLQPSRQLLPEAHIAVRPLSGQFVY